MHGTYNVKLAVQFVIKTRHEATLMRFAWRAFMQKIQAKSCSVGSIPL
jgi:hypothetical protein